MNTTIGRTGTGTAVLRCLRAAAVLAVMLAASCSPDPFSGGVATSGPEVIQVRNSGTFTLELDAGSTAKNVFFVFTNPSDDVIIGATPSVTGSIAVDGVELGKTGGQELLTMEFPDRDPSLRLTGNTLLVPARVRASSFPADSTARTPNFAVVGETKGFTDYLKSTATSTVTVQATCRKVVGPVATAYGDRTLNIWVENAMWDANPSGTRITQAKVDVLADRFLKAGTDNDVYDWVTGILGAEWGPHAYENLLKPTNEIDIFLQDLSTVGQETNGTVAGYFAMGDLITDDSRSNRKVMFFMNALMYAKADGPAWNETDPAPSDIISTLGHEFQHLVQFYQKQVLHTMNRETDRWINEMCSLVVEDFVSYKLGVPGPRGVSATDPTAGPSKNTEGRLPYFNVYSYGALVDNYVNAYPYPVAYSFGAWLMRNYGGADLLRAIVRSPETDEKSITDAVKARGGPNTFEKLVTQWSVAVIASDMTDMPAGYRFNSGGWFESTVDGVVYRLGSIDLYKYRFIDDGYTLDGPDFLTSERMKNLSSVGPVSNLYFLAARSQTGKKSFEVSVPEGVLMTVYLKPAQ